MPEENYLSFADYACQCGKWGGFARSYSNYDTALSVAQQAIDSWRNEYDRFREWERNNSNYFYKGRPEYKHKGSANKAIILETITQMGPIVWRSMDAAIPKDSSKGQQLSDSYTYRRAAACEECAFTLINHDEIYNAEALYPDQIDNPKLKEFIDFFKSTNKDAQVDGKWQCTKKLFPDYYMTLAEVNQGEDDPEYHLTEKDLLKPTQWNERTNAIFESNKITCAIEKEEVEKVTKFQPQTYEILTLDDLKFRKISVLDYRPYDAKIHKNLVSLEDLQQWLKAGGTGEKLMKDVDLDGEIVGVFVSNTIVEPADLPEGSLPRLFILQNIGRAVLADRTRFNGCNDAPVDFAWEVYMSKGPPIVNKWNDFQREATAWGAREKKLVEFVKDKAKPIYTAPNNREVTVDPFGATTLADAGGFLSFIMEQALTSGDTKVGYIHAIRPQVEETVVSSTSILLPKLVDTSYHFPKFRFTVKPTTSSGSGPSNFLATAVSKAKNVVKKVNYSANVTDKYLRKTYARSSLGEDILRSGHCAITIKYDGFSDWKLSQFDQYDKFEGKETVQVHYRVNA